MLYMLVRAAFIARILVILVVALGFLAFLLGTSLTGREMPLGGVAGTALFLAFALHMMLRAQWARFDKKNWEGTGAENRTHSVVHVIGGLAAILQIFFSLLFSAGAVAFFVYIIDRFLIKDDTTLQVTQSFYVILIAFAVYFLLIRPFIGKAGRMVAKTHSAYMPKYEVTADAILIDFNMTMVGKRAKAMNQKVRIGFDELTELKAMTFYEARQYLDFEVGPSITRGIRGFTDMPMFLMGKLPRPRAHVQLQSVGQALLLRGPDLVYAISFGKDDCSDAVQAFEAYKSKNPRP